jgi:hypothetical protein
MVARPIRSLPVIGLAGSSAFGKRFQRLTIQRAFDNSTQLTIILFPAGRLFVQAVDQRNQGRDNDEFEHSTVAGAPGRRPG